MAAAASVTTGKSSYSTTMSLAAASAAFSVSATTAATWSPTKRTMSRPSPLSLSLEEGPGVRAGARAGPHSTGWSGLCRPYSLTGMSLAVKIATTPGNVSTLEVSMLTTRACGRPANNIFMCSIPGMDRSPE